MNTMIGMGVDNIITDDPKLLGEVLRQLVRPQQPEKGAPPTRRFRRPKVLILVMRITIDPATVRENFSRHAENPSLSESAQLFAAGKPVVEMIQALAMNPGVFRAFSGFADVYPCGTLERPIAEKVILRVSQLHECQFCVSSHLAMMHQLGIPTDLWSPLDTRRANGSRSSSLNS